MITIVNEGLTAPKRFFGEDGLIVGYHSIFGWISEGRCIQRLDLRKQAGLSVSHSRWLCRFQVVDLRRSSLQTIEGCSLSPEGEKEWRIELGGRTWRMFVGDEPELNEHVPGPGASDGKRELVGWLLILALFAGLALLSRFFENSDETRVADTPAVELSEPILLRVPKTYQAKVVAPSLKKIESRRAERAPGFLSFFNRANLARALGGVPSHLKEISLGEDSSRTASRGESQFAAGLGIKRASAGNSGLQGLGGLGASTHGSPGGNGSSLAGGARAGLGGLGNGGRLSALPLSNEMVLEGGLDRSVIQATIARYLSQVRACYERGLERQPGLMGQVTMEFAIGAKGLLTYSKVRRSSLGDADVENCIRDRMLSWQFPKPLGGVQVKVSYPFLLRSNNQT